MDVNLTDFGSTHLLSNSKPLTSADVTTEQRVAMQLQPGDMDEDVKLPCAELKSDAVGTPFYTAPELRCPPHDAAIELAAMQHRKDHWPEMYDAMLHSRFYRLASSASDMWSLGASTFAALTGLLPQDIEGHDALHPDLMLCASQHLTFARDCLESAALGMGRLSVSIAARMARLCVTGTGHGQNCASSMPPGGQNALRIHQQAGVFNGPAISTRC